MFFFKQNIKKKDIGKGARNNWGDNEDYAVWSSKMSGDYLYRIWNGAFDRGYKFSEKMNGDVAAESIDSIKKYRKGFLKEYETKSPYLDTQLVLCNSGILVLKALNVPQNQWQIVWQNSGTLDDAKKC